MIKNNIELLVYKGIIYSFFARPFILIPLDACCENRYLYRRINEAQQLYSVSGIKKLRKCQ